MNIEKRDELYRGKAKTVFLTNDDNKLILEFRNDTSAFDGEKIEQLAFLPTLNPYYQIPKLSLKNWI